MIDNDGSQATALCDPPAVAPANDYLKFALSYAARGWSLIPLGGDKRPLYAALPKDPNSGKAAWKPYATKRADKETLRSWFTRDDVRGIGVILGAASGMLGCRDFDAEGAYERWSSQHPGPAATLPTVRTGRGWHVYFRVADEKFCGMDDGEYRADSGHYCVVPPTIHPSGQAYTWAVALPDGDLPVVDPVQAGFLNTASTLTQRTQTDTEGVSGFSVGSVCSETSESSVVSVSTESSVSQLGEVLQHEGVQAAISSTIPDGASQRHRRVFELARSLRALPALKLVKVGAMKPIVKQWYSEAQERVRMNGTFDETWADFVAGVEKVKYPKGSGAMDLIIAKAENEDVPNCAKVQGYGPDVTFLVAVCRELSRAAGDEGRFFLAVRTVADIIKCNRTLAGLYLRMLCTDGILERLYTGTVKDKKASEFRYLGD